MTSVLQTAFKQLLSKYLGKGKLTVENQAVVVAYSGGLDSTSVLLLAQQYCQDNNLPVKAVHVNHQLSANATLWQAHCEAVCSHLNIPFQAKSVVVDAGGNSLEAAARQQRYAAIAEMSKPQDLILLGQHKDDQVETLLLQLLRGAGPQGLSAMAEYSVNHHGSRLLRPLLEFTKKQLAEFVTSTGINWVEDESNGDSRYDRNYLRNEVLPLLTARWPGAVESLARSVRHIQNHEQLLQQQVADKYAAVLLEKTQLSIPLLKPLSVDWQAQIIKHWVKQRGHSQPSEKVLQRILIDCVASKKDAQPVVCWGGWQCCRFNDALYLLPETGEPSVAVIDLKFAQTRLPGACGYIYFSRNKPGTYIPGLQEIYLNVEGQIAIEFGRFSRRFKPVDARQSKPLKQWFKLWNIPAWERKKMPLLVVDGEVVAVGNRISANLQQRTAKDVSTYYYCWVV